ncbi:hotdog domain-containing protein [Williamsia sp. R60]
MSESTGGHPGFDESARPWRSKTLPGGEGSYGPAWAELTDALADFLDRLAAAAPDEAMVRSLTGELAAWADKLEPHAVVERERVFGRRTDLAGRGQTMSPKVVVTASTPDTVEATVRFGDYFLGGNGAAHGGAVPLMFDEVLGRLANSAGRPAQRTAFLHTDYRSITPIGKELSIRGWVEREEGRKRYLRATLHQGDVLCAEAEGLFVALKPGQP